MNARIVKAKLIKVGDVRVVGGRVTAVRTSASGKTVFITTEMYGTERLSPETGISVVRTQRPEVDPCLVCRGSTDTDDCAYHWRNRWSSKGVGFTCSDKCSDLLEAERTGQNREITTAGVYRARRKYQEERKDTGNGSDPR